MQIKTYLSNFLAYNPLAALHGVRVPADVEGAVVAVGALRAPVQLAVRARLRVDLLYYFTTCGTQLLQAEYSPTESASSECTG